MVTIIIYATQTLFLYLKCNSIGDNHIACSPYAALSNLSRGRRSMILSAECDTPPKKCRPQNGAPSPISISDVLVHVATTMCLYQNDRAPGANMAGTCFLFFASLLPLQILFFFFFLSLSLSREFNACSPGRRFRCHHS